MGRQRALLLAWFLGELSQHVSGQGPIVEFGAPSWFVRNKVGVLLEFDFLVQCSLHLQVWPWRSELASKNTTSESLVNLVRYGAMSSSCCRMGGTTCQKCDLLIKKKLQR